MAEIKIEKKKPFLIWLLLALGTVVVLIYLMYPSNLNDETKKNPDTTTALIEVNENNAIVSAFIDFIEIDSNRMSLDHAFTSEGLSKLANATNAIAEAAGYVVNADIDSVLMYAEMITQNSLETTHADNIRSASDILTKVLQNVQLAKYPGLTSETAELKKASISINPDVLTLDQQDAVISYFNKAALLLKKMN